MLPSVHTGSLNGALGRSLQRSTSNNGIHRASEVGGKPSRSAPISTSPKKTRDDRFEFLKQNARTQQFDDLGDLLVFELPQRVGTLGAYRSDAARDRSPERLHLDRLGLTSCPLLEKEEKLKILSYQSNLISRIENLDGLKQLVFLDLYGNKVEHMENFEDVPNLKVLMLGKNQISRIQNLEMVTRLDVLDLHSNRIANIEKVDHLKDLRVLNLAGNSIQKVQNIDKLVSLTELNLRRNLLTSLEGMAASSSLQRIFASRNQLCSFEGLEPLGQLRKLSELALDGNLVCDLPAYQSHIFNLCPSLDILDGNLNDEALKRDETQSVSTNKLMLRDSSPIDEARRALTSTALLIENRSKDLDRSAAYVAGFHGDVSVHSYRTNTNQAEKVSLEIFEQNIEKASGSSGRPVGNGPVRLPGAESKRPLSASRISGGSIATRRPGSIQPSKSKGVVGTIKPRPSSAGTGGRVQDETQVGTAGRRTQSRVPPVDRRTNTQAHLSTSKVEEQSKTTNSNSIQQKMMSSHDVLSEIRSQWMKAIAAGLTPSVRYGYVRREQANELAVYGRGLEALDKPEYQRVITSIHFNFIVISSVLLDTSRLLKFEGLSSIVFSSNQIFTFSQLEALQQLPALTSLTIVDNPICEMCSALRVQAIQCLPKLQTFNNKDVVEAERQLASQIFAPFEKLTRSSGLSRSGDDDKTTCQIANLVDELTSHACAVDEKLRVVHAHFDDAVREAIREAWDDALAMSGGGREEYGLFRMQ